MTPWVKRWGFLIGLLAILLTLGSFTLDTIWVFDVLAALRLQAVIGCAVLAVAACLFGRWYAATLLAGAAGINLLLMVPFILSEPPAPKADARPFSVLFHNTARNTLENFPLVEFIRDRKPDLLAFTELDGWDVENMRRKLPDYPYSVGDPGIFGVVVLSRLPIHDFRVIPSVAGPAGRILEFRICDRLRPGACTAILAQHAARPIGSTSFASRQRQIEALVSEAHRAAEEPSVDGRVVVIGDFNLTAWSDLYNDALMDGNLKDAFAGGVPHSTWFSSFAAMGLAIDHVWVGRGVGVIRTGIGPLAGSDHLPIYAEMGIDIDLRR